MLKRALIGLAKGLLIGGVLAAILVKGLGVAVFGALLAYPLAVLVGVITGLVAGKPIWAADGRIEATLKAVVGALVGAGAMFALRTWVGANVDLSALGAGQGALGELPAVSLPLISTALALLFELDNTGEPAEDSGKKRVAPEKARVADELESDLESEEVAAGSSKLRRKG